jgi:L,D-peptidoglycan transpeptidase YkuD (ErfK/YbiS/YcfS/YnhG family)
MKRGHLRKLLNRKRKFLRATALSLAIGAAGGSVASVAHAKDLSKPVKYQPSVADRNGEWSDIEPPKIPFDRPHIDAELERIYKLIADAKLDKAIDRVNRLIDQYPNFRVAYLIRGDLYTLRAGRSIVSVGDVRDAPLSKMATLSDLREEAIVRLRAYRIRPSANQVPRELVQLRTDQRYAILVDTVRSRLFIYENSAGGPRLITDFYISQGKAGANKMREGDNKTPLGVYQITELLPKHKLTDFYGNLALPLDYPNEWDKREGRTGHGIWLHGVPSNQISSPPKASEGCVVLSNSDIEKLQRYVKVGNTPVIITENINFIAKNIWQSERADILKLLAGKSSDNISVFRYPSRDDMLVISFDERQSRPNGKNPGPKRQQYWQREGREWRIVHEAQTG